MRRRRMRIWDGISHQSRMTHHLLTLQLRELLRTQLHLQRALPLLRMRLALLECYQERVSSVLIQWMMEIGPPCWRWASLASHPPLGV